MSVHKRIGLLALASVLIAGCSSPKPLPTVVPDQCLIAGPFSSAEYDKCVADNEIKKKEALAALLDDTFTYPHQALLRPGIERQPSDVFNPSDYMIYQGVDWISVAGKRALPFKIRIIWKYTSQGFMPDPLEEKRMVEMEKLVLPGVQDTGQGVWVCTVSGEQKRQWIFYTQSTEAFIARTQAVLSQTGPYPIELVAQKETASSTDTSGAENNAKYIRVVPQECVK